MRLVDGERTVLEWSVTVDAAPEHADSWHGLLSSLIATWAASLKASLARGGAASTMAASGS